jgi:glycolate oxidase FAD binding subunit
MTLAKMGVEQAVRELRSLIDASCIAERQDDSEPEHPYALIAPIVVMPRNEKDINRILSWAAEHRMTVAPQGGGTKDALGYPPAADLLLSMKGLSGIIDHSYGDLTVTVLPGTTLAELQRHLGEKGQFLPLDPAFPEHCTIGGIVSANSSGPRRAMYGSARDYVMAARVVYPDGRLIRTGAKVVKNVAGYDMNKLLIGAMGTLGVITELTLKTRPIPASSGLMLVTGSMDALRELQGALLDSQVEPSVCEWIHGALAETFGVGSDESIIAVGFEDVERAVEYQMLWVTDYSKKNGLVVLNRLTGRERVEPVCRAIQELVPNAKQADPRELLVTLKLLSALTDVPPVLQRVKQAAAERGLGLQFGGGLYTGIARAAVKTKWDRIEAVKAWIVEVQAFMRGIQGAAIVEFAPAALRKAVSVWGDPSPTDALMRGIKMTVDPHRTLNAGRFLGGI